jgi:hypothetical protein
METRRSRRTPLRFGIGAALFTLICVGMPLSAQAVDNIYFDGSAANDTWKQSVLQNYVAGGRNGLTSTLTILKAQTLTSGGAVWHSAVGIVGTPVDFVHAPVNGARSRCSFSYAGGGLSGDTHLICKVRK